MVHIESGMDSFSMNFAVAILIIKIQHWFIIHSWNV